MPQELTTSQINRLGDRIRKSEPTPADQEMLETFRRSFNPALRTVVGSLHALGLQATERIKTTFSIVQKLQRESIRLSKLQDIAGCRIIVENIERQNQTGRDIVESLPNASLIDRRAKPTHGYRAVHFVCEVDGRLVEIQVRTEMQHLWAAWSETLATALDQSIKYGGGPSGVQKLLLLESNLIAMLEAQEESTKAGLELLGQMGLPSSLDALIEKFTQSSLPPDLVTARQFMVSTFELALEERKLREQLIHRILKWKSQGEPQ